MLITACKCALCLLYVGKVIIIALTLCYSFTNSLIQIIAMQCACNACMCGYKIGMISMINILLCSYMDSEQPSDKTLVYYCTHIIYNCSIY